MLTWHSLHLVKAKFFKFLQCTVTIFCLPREYVEKRKKLLVCFSFHCESMPFLCGRMSALIGKGIGRRGLYHYHSSEVTTHPISSCFLNFPVSFFYPHFTWQKHIPLSSWRVRANPHAVYADKDAGTRQTDLPGQALYPNQKLWNILDSWVRLFTLLASPGNTYICCECLCYVVEWWQGK